MEARPDSVKTAQWILLASFPIFDEDCALVYIDGITVNINA